MVFLGRGGVDIIAHSSGTRVAGAYAAAGAPVHRLALIAPPAIWLTGTPSDVPELARSRNSETSIDMALAAPPPDFTNETAFHEQQRLTAPLGYAR